MYAREDATPKGFDRLLHYRKQRVIKRKGGNVCLPVQPCLEELKIVTYGKEVGREGRERVPVSSSHN